MADKDDETSEIFMYIHFYAMSGAASIKQPNNLLKRNLVYWPLIENRKKGIGENEYRQL